MHLFYTPDITDQSYTLNEDESKHCIRVLRMQAGDKVNLIDGKGGFYTAVIEEANPKKCVLHIIKSEKEYGKRNTFLHLGIAPTKNTDRIEWFLEKATELGIDKITPLNCEHSERVVIKHDRLHKVIVSAAKQSIKAYLPELDELKSFKEFISIPFEGQKYIAHCEDNSEKKHLTEVYKAGQNILILIGPEGDFSKEEIDLAQQSGFIPVSLSNSRLRTETAALMAVAMINSINKE